MKKIILIFIIAFTAQTVCCEEISNPVEVTKGIQLLLPSSWVAIPDNILESINKGKPRRQQWDYAYQLKSSTNWFVYPYILIRISNTGKVPISSFKKYKQPIEANNDLGIIEKQFDDNSFSLFSTAKTEVQGLGPVIMKSGLIFTEKGYFEICCYINEDSSIDYLKFFDGVLKNIKLDSTMKYKSVKQNFFLSVVSESKHVFSMAIGATFAILIINFIKRKKKIS